MSVDSIEVTMARGRAFVDAIVAHDWAGIAGCFEPGAPFHAVIPGAKPFREHDGGSAAADQMRRWFGDADITELVSCTIEPMTDRVHVTYRIHEHEPDGWYLVEQHAFITPGGGGIAAMNLLCSGFRPVSE
jgi:hypothetical protein